MRVIGIVAEFNPFHQGHENLISRAREIVNDPRAIVMPVISESFVQRGLPAVIPADVRTKQALRCGADVVLGLPFTYSCAPSARFALGGIATLLGTGVITDIAFGYDAGTPEILKSIADQTDENSPEFKEAIKKQIDEGWLIPCLTLKHGHPSMDDYVWHWYILSGYEEYDGTFMVKVVTYGTYRWLDLDMLWNTGYDRKGGLILFS